MIKEELVEKLPQPWLMRGVALHKGVFYSIFTNPETGEDELWSAKPDTGDAQRPKR